jgi:pimeloyl-ACP methyl ester carboxylesterase
MKLLKTKTFEIAADVVGDESAPKLAILMPGRLDTKDYVNFTSHADFLSKHGYLAVAIDPPGTWDSPGDLNNYTTSTYVKAINELIDYFGNRPTLLLGHSRGGATAMLASSNPVVKELVVVNAAYGNPTPPKPEEVENGILVELRDLPPGNVRTEKKVRFDLPMVYFEDGALHNPKEALSKFTGPKLLVHATRDEFTRLNKIKAIYDSLPEPKMFLAIDCTHDYRLFPEVIEQVNKKLGDFLDTYAGEGQ